VTIIIKKSASGVVIPPSADILVAARKSFWLVLALIIGSAPSSAQEPNAKQNQSSLPPVEVWNLLESNLTVVERVADLPKGVRTALAEVLHQRELEMADRDHEVQPRCADCVVDRLIFAGVSPGGCFVHYSATGLTTSYNIIVFDTTGQKGVHPLWAARGTRADNLEKLRSLVAEGRFHPI
jgi:hypothetical protein